MIPFGLLAEIAGRVYYKKIQLLTNKQIGSNFSNMIDGFPDSPYRGDSKAETPHADSDDDSLFDSASGTVLDPVLESTLR